MAKQRFVVFQSGLTGRKFVIDLWRKRLTDLRKKLLAWSEAVTPLWERRGVKKVMIMLTYAPGKEWSPNDITKYLKALGRRSGLEVLAYAWVAEVQERGVVHYHIVLLYKGTLPYPDKSGMWLHGWSGTRFKLRTPYYIIRYTGKEYQKDFSKLPNGARAYGVSISNPDLRSEMKALLLPEHVRERYRVEGSSALDDLQKPSWLRAKFVGSSYSSDFADFMASED